MHDVFMECGNITDWVLFHWNVLHVLNYNYNLFIDL